MQFEGRIGARSTRAYAQAALVVRRANALEHEFKPLSEGDLRKASLDLRWRVKGGRIS